MAMPKYADWKNIARSPRLVSDTTPKHDGKSNGFNSHDCGKSEHHSKNDEIVILQTKQMGIWGGGRAPAVAWVYTRTVAVRVAAYSNRIHVPITIECMNAECAHDASDHHIL
jgi:hypothetical protein